MITLIFLGGGGGGGGAYIPQKHKIGPRKYSGLLVQTKDVFCAECFLLISSSTKLVPSRII